MEHKCLSPWKGAAAGGLIVFAWGAASWMVLPTNDPKGQTAPTDPFIFLSYRAEGWGSMGASMALGLLMQMVGAFFWTWILGKIPGLTTRDSALYGLFFGLCIGTLGVMPNWVWWKWPLGFSLLYVLDAAIAWTAASVVIARFCQASLCALPARPNAP